MKTRGIEILDDGALLLPYGRSVPEAFWSRLKHQATKAGELDAMAEDYRKRRDAHLAAKAMLLHSEALVADADAEAAYFRAWAEKLCGPQERWPWGRGWTPEAVDSYLLEPAKRGAA